MSKAMEKIKRNAADAVGLEDLERALASGKKLRVKLGVDPTSCDLHLGHSVVLEKLREFQDLGHTAVLIIGDFTARVGDPSGRDSTRPVLEDSEIKANAETYTRQAFKILKREMTEIHYNSEWLEDFMASGGFLETAKRTTISRLMEREDFKNRMKARNPISLLEILYPVFQGYDSVAVKADVELGGNDQIFNLLVGRDIQKIFGLSPQTVITMPLLVGTDGVKKMSKSYGNYIALNDSPADMFGKTMSLPDAAMSEYYKIFTDISPDEIRRLHPMEAKKRLAFMITSKYHGNEAASEQKSRFEKVFSRGEIPDEMPEFHLEGAAKLSEVIFRSGMAKSRNEARRLIAQGGIRINGEKISEDRTVGPGEDFILQSGKRQFRKIKGRG